MLSSRLDSSRNTLWSRARSEIIAESAVGSRSLLKVPVIPAMESLEELALPELLPPLLFCGGSLFGAKAIKTEQKENFSQDFKRIQRRFKDSFNCF